MAGGGEVGSMCAIARVREHKTLLKRADLESREAESLAPYAMKSSETRGRRYSELPDPYRTAYQRDRDRIIHCTAFRRLEYKTQVFVNHEGDYYRTRLTHTIEVAQVAETVARALGLNEDLTEAISLAHDVGHTPFGHSGEEALREAMKEAMKDCDEPARGFEHNAHGLRVVDVLEKRYPNFRGLNLTFEVREAIAKHKTAYDVPLSGEFHSEELPVLEAQVVEMADSIAYDSHDLDDGLEAGILDEDRLESVSLWGKAAELVRGGGAERASVRRVQTVRALISLQVVDLLEETGRNIKRLGVRCTDDVRKAGEYATCFSAEMAEEKRELQSFLMENLYRHYRVIRMAEKAKLFVRRLFSALIEKPEQLPPEYQNWAKKVGKERATCDYIAGLTDRSAQDEYKKLFYPYERM